MKQGFIFLLLLVPAFSMFNWNDPDGRKLGTFFFISLDRPYPFPLIGNC